MSEFELNQQIMREKNATICKLYEQNCVLLEALTGIRDLARTGTAPEAYGMDTTQWNFHKINQIAGMANKTIALVESEYANE